MLLSSLFYCSLIVVIHEKAVVAAVAGCGTMAAIQMAGWQKLLSLWRLDKSAVRIV